MRFTGGHLVVVVGVLVGGCSATNSEYSAPSALSRPTSWAEVDEALDRLAMSTSMTAAEVAEDGTLTPLHERAPDSIQAIGTSFFIYVLGIVTDQIAGGDLRWDDELFTTAESRSLPPGQLQSRPDGSAVTVREAAELMMAGSDNTAADLLIDAVGRDRVEFLLASMGMGEESQAQTLPLLTTRERFIIAFALDTTTRSGYAQGDEANRRRLLLNLPGSLPAADASDRDPVDLETIGWFASPVELARAHLWIDSQRGLPGQEPLEEILASIPGTPLDATAWATRSFSAANEPGVFSFSCLLRRSDGRRFVVAIIANDPNGAVESASALSLAAGVIDLLASA